MKTSWSCRFTFVAVAVAIMNRPSFSQTQSFPWEKLKFSEHLQSLKVGGDIRLRQENFDRRGAGTAGRNRNRFRLRFGVEAQLPQGVLAAFRLASGGGEQTSTNQTYSNLSSQKDFRIDQAYVKWTPSLAENGAVSLASGRVPNPLWRTYSSDILWDDDFNPEGFAQNLEWLFADFSMTAFVNALQMAAHEQTGTSKNPWLFSQQLGAETRLPWESRVRLAAAYHKWSNENKVSFSPTTILDGNRRTSGVLSNRFGVTELTGQISSWAGALPLSFQATLIRNMRARRDTAGPRASDGYQYGAVFGQAKNAGGWEAAWFKKYSQTDATVADVSDSDFGDGGTNRRGHVFWLAYAPADWAQVKAKYFITETLDTTLSPGDKAVNRLQLDISVKF